MDSTNITSLTTGHAELVAIFPTPATSPEQRTLADYVPRRTISRFKPPGPRRVYCGKFLDYGPYASFAPSFDQDGVEVGRYALGEVIFQQDMKRRLRRLAKGKGRADASADLIGDGDVSMLDAAQTTPQVATDGSESILLPEDVAHIKSALGTLEMEEALEELLKKNGKALVRLEELQVQRLVSGESVVKEDSEEWALGTKFLCPQCPVASLTVVRV